MIEERDSVEAAVSAQWTAVLGYIPDDFDADFFSSGGTSVMAAVLISRLADTFGFEPTLQIVFDHRSIRALANWVRERPEARTTRVLPLSPKRRNSRPALLFVPGVSGDLILLNQLTNAAFHRAVWGVESRGFAADDGGPLCDAAAIASDLAEQFESQLSVREAHVGGFSTGATLSLALAVELRSRNWDVLSLSMLGPIVPGGIGDRTYAQIVEGRLRTLLDRHLNDVELDPDLISAMLRADYNEITDAQVQDLSRRAHVWAANSYAVAKYSPPPPPPVPTIVVLDTDTGRHEAYWREYFAGGRMELYLSDLDHFPLISEAVVPRMLAELLRGIDASTS